MMTDNDNTADGWYCFSDSNATSNADLWNTWEPMRLIERRHRKKWLRATPRLPAFQLRKWHIRYLQWIQLTLRWMRELPPLRMVLLKIRCVRLLS